MIQKSGLTLILIIMVAGCVTPANTPEKPIGKGYVNLCISDPARADYWQNTDDTLWSSPGNSGQGNDRKAVAGFSSCDNFSVTIWEYALNDAVEWIHVTIHTKDGRSPDGWLVADHVMQTSDETGTEWSDNYYSLAGRWDQTQRGNGAKIWYDFKTDRTFTFNYDMMGNREDIQDKGSWAYLGNKTYILISNISGGHEPVYLTLYNDGKSFNSGIQYSSDLAVGRELVYVKE
ncbi:MAG TPA: hypothetical protein VFC43_04895 [Methanoregula sp.]|nr:hypothetical protein [Methanoregula sp.]